MASQEALLSGFETPLSPWKQSAACLRRGRSHFGAAIVLDNRVVVVGGRNEEKTLRSVEIFDGSTWSKKGFKLKERRAEFGFAAVNYHKLYVLGGCNAVGECLDSIEYLDLQDKSPKWCTLKTSLSSKRRGCTAVAVGSLIYVIGGNTTQVDIFDTKTQQLYKGPSLKTRRTACASALLEDVIYLVGGQDENGTILDSVESLCVSPSKTGACWQTCPAMALSTPRVHPALASISHCLIVIGGRSSSSGHELATVEVVDTKRNVSWKLGKDMVRPRVGSSAITLRSSHVMVVGGIGSCLDSTEVLKLNLLDYETLINSVEKELQRMKRESSFFNKRKSKPQRADLKAYLRYLKKEQYQDDYLSSSSSYASRDDIGRGFSGELPVYDNGRIEAKRELKESGQARVYKGIMKGKDGDPKSSTEVAIKVFKSKRDWDDCKQELVTLLKISGHANVMEVLDFWEVPMPAFCMRYVKGGDLRDYLDKKGKFVGKRAVNLLAGIGEGLRHLHRNGIVHRDLKSLNILVEGKANNLTPVVIDLGLGKSVKKATDEYQTTGFKGTAHWMAPEMIKDGKWSNKTDMYALGVIMWEILTGEWPYPGMKFMQILTYVQNKQGRPDFAGQMKKAKVSESHQAMVHRLWHTDPSKRPSADEFVAALL